ncbi:major facilitator superfamily transporter [Ceratobasidium sp. AG-Ba]|nr:major facilitator superfamily transporter [Ceratobasidium sp. AG-Ba]QRW06437.1 major facilitator superfamily transporter [Ceratobasidium sp. AG-Ba]
MVFKYPAQMIEEIGVTDDPKAIGYYSGLVEGVFALAQFCTVWFWGSLSDKIGRRPVLILGLCGIIGSTVLFGLSRSFPMMLASRILGGALSGNSAVIKSVVGEITDQTNQGTAFAYLPLAWSIGALVAPALGGFLSHPVERYPSIFHSATLFRRYPYLLPCLTGAGLSAFGLVAGFLFLEESLAEKHDKNPEDPEQRPLLPKPSHSTSRCSSSSASTCADIDKTTYSIREILGIPAIRRVLVSYGVMALVTVSVNAVFVLWLYTPIHLGGMGFNSAEIGGALALSGIFGTGIAVIVFPPLERRVGTTILFQLGMVLQVVSITTFPLGHLVAENGGRWGAYIGAAVMLAVRCIAGMVFVCNTLLITRASPSRRALGTVNGLAQMVASASRAIGPAATTSLFAFSIKSNILGGNLVWLVLGLVALVGVGAGLRLPSDRSKATSQMDSPTSEPRTPA